jgi:signal transduction histidine kinase
MRGKTTFPSLTSVRHLKTIFRRFSLRTQLLLIFLFVLIISISSLSIIYSQAEQAIMDKIGDSMDDMTKAIQISVEQMTYEGDSTERLRNTVAMLNRKGIKEISIIGDDSQVIASSNPKKVGTVDAPRRTAVKGPYRKGFFITAKLGEDGGKKKNQRLYNVIMPVAIKGQTLGYIHISMVLDDFEYLQRRNHVKRILATLFAFGLGIIVSLILADQYTDPIKRIARAAKEIAEGKLVKIRESKRKDEIGVLIGSFNEMVEKLRERKDLEEKLKKTEQLSMIGQLASGIAHEVRNPLNFLSLSIGHIKERLREERIGQGDDITNLLDGLTKEIYRVNDMINNFLSLGKPITLNKDWVTADVLMDDILSGIKDKVPEGITVSAEGADMQMRIYCDRDCMRMSLINLVLNAVQAIEESGNVTVRFQEEDGRYAVSVKDTGKGIAAEDIEKVFEPYYSTKKFGIGLGLAITRRFVEEHGGTVRATSTIGQETVVTIRIPVHGIG